MDSDGLLTDEAWLERDLCATESLSIFCDEDFANDSFGNTVGDFVVD